MRELEKENGVKEGQLERQLGESFKVFFIFIVGLNVGLIGLV